MTLRDPDGGLLDLTSVTLRIQIRATGLSEDVLAEVPYTTPSLGVVQFGLAATETAVLPAGEALQDVASRATWALDLLYSEDDVVPLLYGDGAIFRAAAR
jgi:hypothetical protein